ncbi:SDR family oxidoreductase [Oceanospirillum sediminis]|uniref:SDR family oxidoreductase n=1 Tax=Oceanospirillum sediminis TaxID=2760088 RepID=A0A839IWZ0_9GAMM|nr:SDR family oxidoreductase [Oceanospirillum sediminis]MBB1488969.1 SDR family oxidoreductase [Oceanospirillum sediminis]
MMNKRVALVTGASRGIGACIAKRLARDGFDVAVNYSRSEQSALTVVQEIIQDGGQAIAIQADVSDTESVHQMFNAIERKMGTVDVVINNAGIMKLAKLAETTDEHFDSHIDTNLRGTFNTLRESATRINNGGRIVNLSTSVVGLKLESYSIYAATKSAVETLSAIFAKELAGRNITVNCVAPGPTATDLFLTGKPKAVIEKLASMAPLNRLGETDDISSVIAFLTSEDGRWINGQTIRANGGII